VRGCSCLAMRDDSGARTRRASKRRNQDPQYPKAVSTTSPRNGFSSQDNPLHFDLAKAMDRSKTILALVWGLWGQMSNEPTFLPQMCLDAFFGGRVLIAIPNLLRSKMAANEASAVATMRTLNTSAVAYSTTYRSYPTHLTNFGPATTPSSTAADLIDSVIGGSDPATKSRYTFVWTAAGTPVSSYTL
jgi:hypothetical protein